MKVNPRYWPMWEWYSLRDDSTDYRVCRAMVGVGVGFSVAFLMTIVLGTLLLPTAAAKIVSLVVAALIVWGVTFTDKISILSGVPGSVCGRRDDPRREARYYLRFSKQEQGEYPADIINILRNSDVTSAQKDRLSNEMRRVREQLDKKRKIITELNARHVDIDGALTILNDNANGLEREINTYRELM